MGAWLVVLGFLGIVSVGALVASKLAGSKIVPVALIGGGLLTLLAVWAMDTAGSLGRILGGG